MKAMWTSTFAKKIGFKNAREKGFWKTLNYLEKIGAIKIEQSGFRSDSNRHKKLVVIKQPNLVFNYLKIQFDEGKLRMDSIKPKSSDKLQEKNSVESQKTSDDKKAKEKNEIFDFVGFVEKVLMEIPNEIPVDEIFVDRLYDFVLNEYYLQDRLESVSPRAIANSFLEEIGEGGKY